jgi:poly-gamma-glutamate synthesis protein (capsule biosynthesis protein)
LNARATDRPARLFLAGDVMLGRGIDQILPTPSDPRLYEGWVTRATDYVTLAERANGPIPRAVPFAYVWGDLAADLDRRACDLRIVNLETAITVADRPAAKGINYRMHPANAGVLTAARIDACTLANNHVLDWGRDGLLETLDTLDATGIGHAGAGRSARTSEAPLVMDMPGGGRVLLLSYGTESSGIPANWAAEPDRAGINLMPTSQAATVSAARDLISPLRRPGDLVLFSVHWGDNWGYVIPAAQRSLAHALIDTAGVDAVVGHSSHHPKAIELHRGKLVLYGCGDLINDYEGIAGYEEFRGDLGLGYVADFGTGGQLAALEMLPYRRSRFRLIRAGDEDFAWIGQVMRREMTAPGMWLQRTEAGTLRLAPERG